MIVTGTPCSGPRGSPRDRAASAAAASFRARSNRGTTTAFKRGFTSSMRWICSSTTSRAERSPEAKRFAIPSAPRVNEVVGSRIAYTSLRQGPAGETVVGMRTSVGTSLDRRYLDLRLLAQRGGEADARSLSLFIPLGEVRCRLRRIPDVRFHAALPHSGIGSGSAWPPKGLGRRPCPHPIYKADTALRSPLLGGVVNRFRSGRVCVVSTEGENSCLEAVYTGASRSSPR